MKNFIFKSTGADLQKIFQYLETQQKNMVYATYQLDKCLKILRSMEIEDNAQKQVDDFYKTSPQTDASEHEQENREY